MNENDLKRQKKVLAIVVASITAVIILTMFSTMHLAKGTYSYESSYTNIEKNERDQYAALGYSCSIASAAKTNYRCKCNDNSGCGSSSNKSPKGTVIDPVDVSSVGTMQGLGWTCESYSVPAKYNCNCNSPKIVTSDGCVTPTSSSTLQGTTCNDYYDRPTCEENGCSWTNANGCTTPSSASSTTGATAAPSTGVTSDPNEKRECYCNTCENGSWVSVAKGNVTKTTCNSMNSGCDDVTWGYVLTGRSCGGSATYTVTFLNANGDGSEFYKACKTNTSGYLTNDCISEISGVCSSWSHSKWNGGAPQSGGVSAASIGAKKFTSDDTYYCVAGTSIHPNGNGGGNNNPTPASASTSGGSTTSNTSCYQCTVNGSTKYTYAKSATEAASNLNGTNCKATADSNCKSSNTPVNPQTGTAGIIVAWLVGLSAIVYSLWYFKRSSSIN